MTRTRRMLILTGPSVAPVITGSPSAQAVVPVVGLAHRARASATTAVLPC